MRSHNCLVFQQTNSLIYKLSDKCLSCFGVKKFAAMNDEAVV